MAVIENCELSAIASMKSNKNTIIEGNIIRRCYYGIRFYQCQANIVIQDNHLSEISFSVRDHNQIKSKREKRTKLRVTNIKHDNDIVSIDSSIGKLYEFLCHYQKQYIE
jgi:parallel beta-helix repeat protein